MVRLFTGWDAREAAGWHVFVQSLIDTSTDYWLMPPLHGEQGDGTNTFSIARFELFDRCNWAGKAVFVDAVDMILMADIAELVALFDKTKAIQVVPHSYKTKHPRKYIGTEMESDNADYPDKNRSSVMLVNVGHPAHWKARKEIHSAIERGDGKFLHRFGWLPGNLIGELPMEWNWLPQEHGENPNAKLIHYTLGHPGFKHYRDSPMASYWHKSARTWHSER